MTQNSFEKTGNDALDAAFAAARAARPQPSAALMAAIRADAAREAAAARPRPAPARAAIGPRWGFWRALGGWPAVGTLAASLVLGVAVGAQQAVPLAGLDLLARGPDPLAENATADLLPGIDAFLTEG